MSTRWSTANRRRRSLRRTTGAPQASKRPETRAILAPPGWRNWSYAPDLKSGVSSGGVRVRVPSPAPLCSARRDDPHRLVEVRVAVVHEVGVGGHLEFEGTVCVRVDRQLEPAG